MEELENILFRTLFPRSQRERRILTERGNRHTLYDHDMWLEEEVAAVEEDYVEHTLDLSVHKGLVGMDIHRILFLGKRVDNLVMKMKVEVVEVVEIYIPHGKGEIDFEADKLVMVFYDNLDNFRVEGKQHQLCADDSILLLLLFGMGADISVARNVVVVGGNIAALLE